MNDYLNKRLKEVFDYVNQDLENNNIRIDLVLYNPINNAAKIIIVYPTKLKKSGKSPNTMRLKTVVNIICE